MNETRLNGDIHYLLTGDQEQLTPDSIYSKLIKKGKDPSIYSRYFQEHPIDNYFEFYWNFEHFWETTGKVGMRPCITKITYDPEDNYLFFVFSRVCPEQFQYDIKAFQTILNFSETTSTGFHGIVKWFKEADDD